MSLLWGGFRVFIVIIKAFNHYFSSIADLLEDVVQTLPRVQEYHKLFPDSKMLAESVNQYYHEIWLFCARVAKEFQGSVKSITFKATKYALWTDFDKIFESHISNLKRWSKETEKQAHLAQMVKLGKFIEDFNVASPANVTASPTSVKVDEVKDKILNFVQNLQCFDPEGDLRSLLRQRMDNTGRWILQTDEYKEWLNSNSSPSNILWIHGIPGCGKSVLAGTVVSDLRNQCFNNTFFFFCSFRDDKKVEAKNVLGGVLAQIIDVEDEGIRKIVCEKIKDIDVDSELGFELVSDTLMALLKHKDRAKVVVDGLDECMEGEQDSLTRFIVKASEQTNTGFVVYSRNYPAICEAFLNNPKLEVTRDSNEHDLRSYVDRFLKEQDLDENDPKEKEVMEKARAQLVHNSKGMFLWVRLMVRELEHAESLYDFEKIIDDQPITLKDSFERVIVRLEKLPSDRRRMTAYKILALIVTAMRPLSLDEISAALAVWDDQSDSGTTSRFDATRKLRKARQTIIDLCGPLVELRAPKIRKRPTNDFNEVDGDVEVVFVHATVKEYLMERFMSHQPSFMNHLQMARICLASMSFEECETPPVGAVLGEDYIVTKQVFRAFLEQLPFLRYAVTYFWFHVTECKELQEMEAVKTQLHDFLSRKKCAVTWWVTFLYLVAFESRDARWTSVLSRYLEHCKSVLRSGRCSPLLKDTINELVAWTLPGDMISMMRFNTTDWLPSAVACFWNWGDIVPELLERQRAKHPQALSPRGRGPLQAAAVSNNAELVEMLINLGIETVIDPHVGDQAIHFAAFCNRTRVIPILLKNGADPILLSYSTMRQTSLHDTVHTGAHEAAKQLITFRPSLIAVKNSDGLTPLEFAAEHGKPRFALMMMRDEAEPVAKGLDQEVKDRALWFAKGRGLPRVVERLLEIGAEEGAEFEKKGTTWEMTRKDKRLVKELKENR